MVAVTECFVAKTRNGTVGTVVIRPKPGKRWEVTVYANGGHASKTCRTQPTARRTALAVRDFLVRKGI